MSDCLQRRNGELCLESVPLRAVAERHGTPCYVYSRAHFERQYRALDQALGAVPHRICYAVKANSNLAVLNLFAHLGAGFDVVSGGELERVIRAGGKPDAIVFSGVGKRTDEIDFALKLGIHCFNVESEGELERIEARARLLGRVAPIAIRVNPDIDANTHPYISTGLEHNKFGVPQAQAPGLYRRIENAAHLAARGIDCHIGSLVMEPGPLQEVLQSLLMLVDTLAADGITLEHVDVGGGFGVPYRFEAPFDLAAYGRFVQDAMRHRPQTLIVEPGRLLVANGGVLLTRVEYLKHAAHAGGRSFAVVDMAMNDLIRPPLYQAWHDIEPVTAPGRSAETRAWDIVGPVCESADFVAHARELALGAGDLLAVRSAGAYGFVQSSNYNSRDRAPELLVDGETVTVVRQRETIADQLSLERLPHEPGPA